MTVYGLHIGKILFSENRFLSPTSFVSCFHLEVPANNVFSTFSKCFILFDYVSPSFDLVLLDSGES